MKKIGLVLAITIIPIVSVVVFLMTCVAIIVEEEFIHENEYLID